MAGFFTATKLLIKYSLDTTLAQSNLLLLNPYGYGCEISYSISCATQWWMHGRNICRERERDDNDNDDDDDDSNEQKRKRHPPSYHNIIMRIAKVFLFNTKTFSLLSHRGKSNQRQNPLTLCADDINGIAINAQCDKSACREMENKKNERQKKTGRKTKKEEQ